MKTHKDKKLKASVRNMLKLNIHNPTLVININRQINYLAHKEAQQMPNKQIYNKLILLTDEIAILAESAICSPTPAIIRISQQFIEKQNELKKLYDELFKKTKN